MSTDTSYSINIEMIISLLGLKGRGGGVGFRPNPNRVAKAVGWFCTVSLFSLLRIRRWATTPDQLPQLTYSKTAHFQLLLQGEGAAILLSSEGKLVSLAQATVRRIMAANNAQDSLWFLCITILAPPSTSTSSATTPKCFTPRFTLHASIILYCAVDLAALTGPHKIPTLRRSSPLHSFHPRRRPALRERESAPRSFQPSLHRYNRLYFPGWTIGPLFPRILLEH